MGAGRYARVFAIRDVRRVLLLGTVVRVPLWASNVVLTLHVVTHLHQSYAAAGALAAAATVAIGASGPWRGRRIDRVGLRRALLPSLLVLTACWSVAPFLGYLPLLALSLAAGAFEIPSFSITRQALIALVPDDLRRTALSVDSVAVEISFMIGPVLGVVLATAVPTPWALLGCELASVLGGLLLWLADPPVRGDAPDPVERIRRSSWLTRDVAAVLVASATATLVLGGTDVGVVAALRALHHQAWIGWVLGLWGLGSALGGVAYGALHRPVPLLALVGLLGAATLPVAVAPGPLAFAGLLLVAGVFCAPSLTAAVDQLSRLVPESVRGEAMGWHSAAMTTGVALGSPLAGVAIDAVGWRGAFAVVAGSGLALGAVCLALSRRAVGVETAVRVDAADAPAAAAVRV